MLLLHSLFNSAYPTSTDLQLPNAISVPELLCAMRILLTRYLEGMHKKLLGRNIQRKNQATPTGEHHVAVRLGFKHPAKQRLPTIPMAAIMAPIRSSIVRILRNGKQLVYLPKSPNLIPHRERCAWTMTQLTTERTAGA